MVIGSLASAPRLASPCSVAAATRSVTSSATRVATELIVQRHPGLSRSRPLVRRRTGGHVDERGVGAGHGVLHDICCAPRIRIVDPVEQAPSAQCVVQVTATVGSEHRDRRPFGDERAQFRDGDGGLTEELQQQCLEFVVGAVISSISRTAAPGRGSDALQDRAVDQVRLGVRSDSSIPAPRASASRIDSSCRCSSSRTALRPRSGPHSTAAGVAVCSSRRQEFSPRVLSCRHRVRLSTAADVRG